MTKEQMEKYRDNIIEALRQNSSVAGLASVEPESFEDGKPLPIFLETTDGELLVLELNVA